MLTIKKTNLLGCMEIQPKIFNDNRGQFIKTFNKNNYENMGLETNYEEEYYSHSQRGVLRGMHFQMPPFDHTKVVYCVSGEVQDVLLDLRKNSPTYGKASAIKLSAQIGNLIYIPKGIAHGFFVVSDAATLIYKTSTIYNEKYDSGILWNSFEFNWLSANPIISERDSNFQPLSKFESPFSI